MEDRSDRNDNRPLSHEFAIHVMEFFSAMGGVVALYYLEHPAEFRIGMTRVLRVMSTFCQDRSVFWIRQSKRFLDMSDKVKL